MDWSIYAAILGVIAILFYLRNFVQGNNTMIFVILASVIGLVLYVTSPPTYIDPNNLNLINNSTNAIEAIVLLNTPQDFPYAWVFATSYFVFLIMAVLIWSLSGKEIDDEYKFDY